MKNYIPVPVPSVEPVSEREITLFEGAPRRREIRLVLAGRMKASEAVLVKEYLVNQQS
jgi:hypothetical protein